MANIKERMASVEGMLSGTEERLNTPLNKVPQSQPNTVVYPSPCKDSYVGTRVMKGGTQVPSKEPTIKGVMDALMGCSNVKVDPIDDRIDSSSMIDLCPSNVDTYALNASSLFCNDFVDQSVCECSSLVEGSCSVIKEPQISGTNDNVDQLNGSESLSISFVEDTIACFSHRDLVLENASKDDITCLAFPFDPSTELTCRICVGMFGRNGKHMGIDIVNSFPYEVKRFLRFYHPLEETTLCVGKDSFLDPFSISYLEHDLVECASHGDKRYFPREGKVCTFLYYLFSYDEISCWIRSAFHEDEGILVVYTCWYYPVLWTLYPFDPGECMKDKLLDDDLYGFASSGINWENESLIDSMLCNPFPFDLGVAIQCAECGSNTIYHLHDSSMVLLLDTMCLNELSSALDGVLTWVNTTYAFTVLLLFDIREALCLFGYWSGHMSANGENSCQVGHPAGGAFHRDDIDDVNSVNNPAHMGEMGAICMPQAVGNAMFKVTSAKLQLIHSRGLFGGLEHEDPQEHIRSFV
ncbi:hypothetical protein KY284_010805 [Solanum tuberosum]|nr:hypothetical protein KY284_010805 [Solanum tuberosum]